MLYYARILLLRPINIFMHLVFRELQGNYKEFQGIGISLLSLDTPSQSFLAQNFARFPNNLPNNTKQVIYIHLARRVVRD